MIKKKPYLGFQKLPDSRLEIDSETTNAVLPSKKIQSFPRAFQGFPKTNPEILRASRFLRQLESTQHPKNSWDFHRDRKAYFECLLNPFLTSDLESG